MSLTDLAAVGAFQTMFAWSGVKKILKFDKKCNVLHQKIQTRVGVSAPDYVVKAGMISVIALEIIGSVVLLLYVALKLFGVDNDIFRTIVYLTILAFVVFVIAATYLYHPPEKGKMIPFLSNVNCIGGLMFMSGILLA